MIPLMLTITLSLVSFVCSAFVILRIIIPILPHRYLGRRVYPLAFSYPISYSLPPADKGYIWLALCDLSAAVVFVWETFDQWFDSSSSVGVASNVRSAARLWLALTLRQTCFLIISALIVIHVRLRKSVSFGFAQWYLWVPLVFLAGVSTIAAGLFVDITSRSFLIGYIAYSSTVAMLNTIMFGSLVRSLIIIRRNLALFQVSKCPHKTVETPQITLSAEDIDVIGEGCSWITSPTSSRRETRSLCSSFSTSTRSNRSIPDQASPPRLPLCILQGTQSSASRQTPSPSRGDVYAKDFGLFRHQTQSFRAAALTLGSQKNSWITSSLGTHPTISAWSFATRRSSPPDSVPTGVESAIALTPTQGPSPCNASPVTAVVESVRVLANNSYAPSAPQAERRTSSTGALAHSSQIDISILRIVACLAGIWIPLVLSLPHIICRDSTHFQSNEFASIFLAISVAISSPILVLNSLLRHPIPIPYDIFDAPSKTRSILHHSPSIGSALTFADGYKRGIGTKLIRDDAADGKDFSMPFPRVLATAPRLSILRIGDSSVPFPSTWNWHHVQGLPPPYLPSLAPTRVAPRRHSSTHPHDIADGQHTCSVTRATRQTRSLPSHKPTDKMLRL
ncbi:hypothetical protein F5148DRAFT_349217 [Russula earlei]|uniref:Uncharacterized protein n=1 Tax=Russula earlei TaxID=71964 RepID=A0ACC0U151_9AGAM|nr:hypothetical protein F5148DRAFT_349217 [Russula earlei]